jgi:MFS transporter, DHA1 family, inner membrane transport protein
VSSRAVLLGSLGFLSFATVYNNIVVSPVLVDIARDLGVSIGTAGLLVTAYGIPGIVVGVLAGPLSDRYGRKAFLVWGTVVMSILTASGGAVPGFAYLLLTRVGAGVGAAVIYPNISATVADEFPYHERGQAMSTVVAMNQLATVVGVPLAGLIAGLSSWRWSFVLVGAFGLVAVAVIARSRPTGQVVTEANVGTRELIAEVLTEPSVGAAIVSSLLGAVFWFTWITYVVAFFVERYSLDVTTASLTVLVTGIGIVFGSQAGGRMGDRVGHKVIVGSTIAAGGAVMLLETVVIHDLALAVVASFLIALLAGARFATNQTLLSELAPSARGTLLAVNSAIVSVGIVGGTALGGILIDSVGYEALGVMSTVAGLASAFVVWRFVTERTAEIAAGAAME